MLESNPTLAAAYTVKRWMEYLPFSDLPVSPSRVNSGGRSRRSSPGFKRQIGLRKIS